MVEAVALAKHVACQLNSSQAVRMNLKWQSLCAGHDIQHVQESLCLWSLLLADAMLIIMSVRVLTPVVCCAEARERLCSHGGGIKEAQSESWIQRHDCRAARAING